jgi:formate--tetrahydrofolate ligase
MHDWEIARDAEKRMKRIGQLAAELGAAEDELLPYGHVLGKIDYIKMMDRLGDRPQGKYIDVTAITPTPLGEGKTTTTLGLVEGLGALGKRVSGAIRQPAGAPTFNIKGSAARWTGFPCSRAFRFPSPRSSWRSSRLPPIWQTCEHA